jgi:hypothetical protein
MSARLPNDRPERLGARHTSARLEVAVPAELVEQIARRAATIAAEALAARPEPWIDAKRAAEHLACKPGRLYALAGCTPPRIPHRRDGSRLLFRVSDLDRWLDEGGGRRP